MCIRDSYFAEVEQAAFDPGNFVPGIGPSPDKMFQGRMFAYGDAHRYRLGVNHTQLPVNAPRGTVADNYGRDGLMRFDAGYKGEKNYEPNSFNGPVQTSLPLYNGLATDGLSGSYPWDQRKTDDYTQARNLYLGMPDDAKARFVETVSLALSGVSHQHIIDASIDQFRKVDDDLGERLEKRVIDLQG